MIENSKELGQFFTPINVSRGLAKLLNLEKNKPLDVIDPMCGQGNMLQGMLLEYDNFNFYGIEIDPIHANIAKKLKRTTIINEDAFKYEIYSKNDLSNGFDIVITNPPYVRYQTTSINKQQNLDNVKNNLKKIIKGFNYLDFEEKHNFFKLIDCIKGNSDLSIASTILSMSLIKDNGKLVIILPNSWFSRDYSIDIIKFIEEFFCIEFIIEDTSKVWFKPAQIKTTALILTKNKDVNKLNNINKVKLYNSSIINNSESKELQVFTDNDYFGAKGINLEIKKDINLHLNMYDTDGTSVNNNFLLFLNQKIEENLDVDLISINKIVDIGQGLRTGANYFFYLSKYKEDEEYMELITSKEYNNKKIRINNNFLLPVIRKQDDYKVQEPIIIDNIEGRVLYLKKQIDHDINNLDLSKYIIMAENHIVRDKKIYQMSAVKTNVKKGLNGEVIKEWYQLPELQPRHIPDIFVPRINSNSVNFFGVKNKNIVIDANFSTINVKNYKDRYWILAVLNSTWVKILLEHICTHLGGGALKVEAKDLKSVVIPKLSSQDIKCLSALGKEILEKGLKKECIKKIDNVIYGVLCRTNNIESKELHNKFNNLLCNLIEERRL